MTRVAASHRVSVLARYCIIAILFQSVACQKSVYQSILNREELSLLRDALRFSGYDEDSILANTSQTLTLFAPTNSAIEQDLVVSAYLEHPGWSVHLKEICDLHIVVGGALPSGALFSSNPLLNTKLASLTISKDNQTIGGVSISETLHATNGIVHIVDGVFRNEWRGVTLGDRATSLSSNGLNNAIFGAGFEKELYKISDFGTTFVAASDFDKLFFKKALSKATSVNSSFSGEAYSTLLYNTINVNLYEELLDPGVKYVATPRGGEAQMWVTRDKEGTIRFNDAIASGFEIAENGVFYTVDKLLSPPGIIEFLGITARYSDLDVMDAYDLFLASSWGSSNLAKSVGIEKGKLTLFAPTDNRLNSLPMDEMQRLLDPLWSRHLDDLLKHWLTNKAYKRSALQDLAVSAGGSFELTMLSGSTVSVVTQSDDSLSITDGLIDGSFVKPTNLKGVDGLIHVVETVLLPPSYKYSIYELATNDNQLFVLGSLIETPDIRDLFGGVRPLTFFAPVDVAVDGFSMSANETLDVIQNHMFQGLFYSDMLLEMDGEKITSINNEEFLVTVLDGTVTLSGITSTQTSATIVATDVLANTGVMHRINGILAPNPLLPTGEALLETGTPTQQLTTEMPDETLLPTDETVAPTDETITPTVAATTWETILSTDETVAPTDETIAPTVAVTGEQTEALTQSESISTTQADTSNTVKPSDEVSTLAATVMPTNVSIDSIEPTQSFDQATEELSTEGDPTAPPSAYATGVVFDELKEENGEEEHEIASAPSSSPTQLVEVVTVDSEVERQGEPPMKADDSSSQTSTSATSDAKLCRHFLSLFSAIVMSAAASIFGYAAIF